MKKKLIFLSDFPFSEPGLEEKIAAESSLVADVKRGQCEKPEEVLDQAPDVQALLVHHTPVTAGLIKSLPQLEVIGRYGAGYDVVDVMAATEAGIPVINDPVYCREEVSSQVLSYILALSRGLIPLHNMVTNGGWQREEDFRAAGPLRRLAGRKLGIIGMGNVGFRLAEKAAALNLEVYFYNRRAEEKMAEIRRRKEGKAKADAFAGDSIESLEDIKPLALDELLQRSDFISLHLPLTPQTEAFIGKRELSLMNEEAFLINTARGKIVQEKALVEALKNEEIAGAALDVFWQEPLPEDHPLLELDESRVILTPHSAFYSEEAEKELRESIMEQALTALAGERPRHTVNPEVFGED